LHKELNTIRLIKDYMIQKNVLNHETTHIDDIYYFFQYLNSKENNKKFNSLYILNYIYSFIVSDEVAKRKTSARVFEDLLAILFNGIVTDTEVRKNLKHEVPEYFQLTKDKIAGNKREKIDLLFKNNYGVSVKTLMIDNKELNLGSFERKVLFDGFEVSEYLKERKADGKANIGLGSKPQLRNLMNCLVQNNYYSTFQERLSNMYNFIFSDDMILAIKDNTKFELYFFTGEEFTTIISERVNDIEQLLEVVNRWEGNSIRIDRRLLLESAKRKVIIDLSMLNETIMKLINDFDEQLHLSYVQYFNEKENQSFKKNILVQLEKLFIIFEQNMEELC